MTHGIHFKSVLTPEGWQSGISAELVGNGSFGAFTKDANPKRFPVIAAPVVPGITDLHSHAFQFAMAGLTEVRRNPVDSFWSWRSMMYFFAHRLTPDDMRIVARKLYLELLKGGYTGIAEFHYIHNDHDGQPYANPQELSLSILQAARETGLHLTHLPVFYAHSGFGGQVPNEGQRRFTMNLDQYAGLIESLRSVCADGGHRLGIAPHSLRAVTEDELTALLGMRADLVPDCPIHLHVSEQIKEVEDCLAFCGQRPVERLMNLVPVDGHWCLIHATHPSDSEITAIATSGATVGLCPLTEANLGDGIFNAPAFLNLGGAIGIGSDANVATQAWAELQMLEYGQRLSHRQRNVLARDAYPNLGNALWTLAAEGGARAVGRNTGQMREGYAADFVELTHANAEAASNFAANNILDYRVFGPQPQTVGDVYVGGKKVIDGGHHRNEDEIEASFGAAMARLTESL